MEIREGAYYRTRGGDVVGPMRRTKDQTWYTCYHTWYEDGRMFLSGAEHSLDLISEVHVSDTPPADTPEAQAELKIVVGKMTVNISELVRLGRPYKGGVIWLQSDHPDAIFKWSID